MYLVYYYILPLAKSACAKVKIRFSPAPSPHNTPPASGSVSPTVAASGILGDFGEDSEEEQEGTLQMQKIAALTSAQERSQRLVEALVRKLEKLENQQKFPTAPPSTPGSSSHPPTHQVAADDQFLSNTVKKNLDALYSRLTSAEEIVEQDKAAELLDEIWTREGYGRELVGRRGT